MTHLNNIRKQRTLQEKKKLIKAYDKLPKIFSLNDAAIHLKLSKTTLHDLLKKRDFIENSSKRIGKRTRMRKGIYDSIDQELTKWIEEARRRGFVLNTRVVKNKATELAILYKIKEFSPNEGWFKRFKRRPSWCGPSLPERKLVITHSKKVIV